MADEKWSAFTNVGNVSLTDIIVGLRSGTNVQFNTANLALLDVHSNLSANNFLSGYQSIATAGITTSLTVSSPYMTQFTGSSNQICQMPVVTTLVLGQSYLIVNESTGTVTVNSSGGNAIQAMASNTSILVVCNAITGTTASSWTVVSYAPIDVLFPLSLALGGTNNDLTASAGGIVWSDSNKLNILDGTATANLPLLSGDETTPLWGDFALLLGGALTTEGSLTTLGAFGATFTFTNTTAVTFPTSGTLATVGQVYSPVAAAASTQACAVNTIYYVTYASGCTLTLPTAPALGSIVGVVGDGAGGWILAPNTSQSIKLVTASASTSVASSEQYDCIFVMYVATNVWVAYNMVTTGFTYS